jgi:hypothetical protein
MPPFQLGAVIALSPPDVTIRRSISGRSSRRRKAITVPVSGGAAANQ